jgi:Cytochrome P460
VSARRVRCWLSRVSDDWASARPHFDAVTPVRHLHARVAHPPDVVKRLVVRRLFAINRFARRVGLAPALLLDEVKGDIVKPRNSILVLAVVLLFILVSVTPRGGAQDLRLDLVDAKGNIRKPQGYRDRYQMLGAYVVLDPTSMVADALKANADEMHYTYASPGTAEFYRKNGRFADGTVLVKEVLATSHAQLTTGDAHWAKDTKVWFVMIKDDKTRFPDSPLWGDGWGWALFKSDAPDAQVATNYRKDCLGCHLPAKTTDWIYVQGYPVLNAQ